MYLYKFCMCVRAYKIRRNKKNYHYIVTCYLLKHRIIIVGCGFLYLDLLYITSGVVTITYNTSNYII
jgi:hypothetical protein